MAFTFDGHPRDSSVVATASLAHYEALMKTRIRPGRLAISLLIAHAATAFAAEPIALLTNTVRVAASQAPRRVVDFRLKPEEALAAVEQNLTQLERIVDRAGQAKCDALALPEDTLGLLNWVGANETLAKEVLPKAVKGMIERLGSAAVPHVFGKQRHQLHCRFCLFGRLAVFAQDQRRIGEAREYLPLFERRRGSRELRAFGGEFAPGLLLQERSLFGLEESASKGGLRFR